MTPTAEARRYYSALDQQAVLEEKLFFLDRLPEDVTVFVDFGCGSGSVLKEIIQRRPEAQAIGFDRSPAAIHTACLTLGSNNPNYSLVTSNIQDVYSALRKARSLGRKVCLILSSVVHEMLSEGMSFEWIWLMVESFRADFVAIRDFAYPEEIGLHPQQITRTFRALGSLGSPYFELGMGSMDERFIDKRTSLFALETLLKYQYVENAEAEKQERYLSLSVDQWHNYVTVGSHHKVILFDHHSLPYHRQCWKRDFGLDLNIPTHLKMLLRRTP